MLLNIIRNGIAALWHATQMVFVYSLAILLVITVIYLFYRLEVEVAKDKANRK